MRVFNAPTISRQHHVLTIRGGLSTGKNTRLKYRQSSRLHRNKRGGMTRQLEWEIQVSQNARGEVTYLIYNFGQLTLRGHMDILAGRERWTRRLSISHPRGWRWPRRLQKHPNLLACSTPCARDAPQAHKTENRVKRVGSDAPVAALPAPCEDLPPSWGMETLIIRALAKSHPVDSYRSLVSAVRFP